jgi:hypothetical protein
MLLLSLASCDKDSLYLDYIKACPEGSSFSYTIGQIGNSTTFSLTCEHILTKDYKDNWISVVTKEKNGD